MTLHHANQQSKLKKSNSQDFFRQDQDRDQDFYLKTKTKTKTLFFVLEAPRDQDCGLEDYITGIENTIRTIQYKLLFGSKLGFCRILDLPYGAIWRCSRVRL